MRNHANPCADEGAQRIVNHVIRLNLPKSKAILEKFYAGTHQSKQQDNANKPPPAGPMPRKQFAGQEARREKEGHIHKITAKELSAPSEKNCSVRMEREQLRLHSG